MESVDMTSKIKLLRKKLIKSQKTIWHLKILVLSETALLLIILFILALISINLNKQITTLKTEYNELMESYTKEPTKQSSEFENENDSSIILTDTLVQYSNESSGESSGFKYNSDIPLSEDIQKYAYNKCSEAGIEYPVFLGLMRKESTFNPSAKSGTSDYGLCQINKINHNWMRDVFGSEWDPMDPYDSIDASIFILSDYINNYNCDNYHVLLMNYNMGHGNAVEFFNKGIYSSDYSRVIMEYAKEYGYSGDGQVRAF